MKKLLVVITMVFMMAIAVNASAVVLDFEDLSGYGFMPDPYQGVIDWEDGVWAYYDSFSPPYNPSSGVSAAFVFEDYDDTPSWDFLTPVIYDGSFFSGYSGGTVQMDLYYSNVLVHSTGILAPSSAPAFLATGYSGFVDRVVINNPDPTDWAMDDITYNSTQAPEPMTIILLGSGMAGLALLRRMRNK